MYNEIFIEHNINVEMVGQSRKIELNDQEKKKIKWKFHQQKILENLRK